MRPPPTSAKSTSCFNIGSSFGRTVPINRSRMLKRASIIAAVTLFTGCATAPGGTTAGIKNNEPVVRVATLKSAEEVTRCLSPKFVDIYGSPNVMPADTGATVIVGAPPEIVVDVMDRSSVSLFMARKLWGSIDDRYRSAVEACA